MRVFRNLKFEYPAMGGKTNNYNYEKAKDYITWNQLEPKNIIPLIDMMFDSFVSAIPTK